MSHIYIFFLSLSPCDWIAWALDAGNMLYAVLKIASGLFISFFFFLLGPSNVFKIVKMIMERNFQPVIIFSFSKKECEAYALQVAKLDFNTGINVIIINNALF